MIRFRLSKIGHAFGSHCYRKGRVKQDLVSLIAVTYLGVRGMAPLQGHPTSDLYGVLKYHACGSPAGCLLYMLALRTFLQSMLSRISGSWINFPLLLDVCRPLPKSCTELTDRR